MFATRDDCVVNVVVGSLLGCIGGRCSYASRWLQEAGHGRLCGPLVDVSALGSLWMRCRNVGMPRACEYVRRRVKWL